MKTVSELLSSGTLKAYLEKAACLDHLNTIFETVIPPDFVSHCKIANFENGCLTVYANNSGWATRIRYAIPELLKVLKIDDNFKGLKEIKCKVLP